MPSGNVDLATRRPIAFLDENTETGTKVQPASTGNKIMSFRTPAGAESEITDYRQAWDAGLDTFLSHYLKVNGAIVWPFQTRNETNPTYVGSKVQIAPPEQDVALPRPIPVGQNALVEMYVDVAAGAAAGNVTGRIIIKSYDLERPRSVKTK